MPCKSCQSKNQDAFHSELSIHFPGRDGLTRPTVMVAPKLVVCLDCGFTEFQIEEAELRKLIGGTRAA